MRIITGKLKGRSIPIPDTGELRPTSDRTKEGIFSIIAARRYFEDTVVLDLFGGSGNLGFEAISRGSKHVTFVDSNPAHTAHINKLADTFGIAGQVHTITKETETYLDGPQSSFDFIFADPPYDYFNMIPMISTILDGNWLHSDGWFILEHDKRHDFSGHERCVFSKPYGRTIVSIFLKPGADF